MRLRLCHLLHATAEQADVVLPAGTFAEADGTLVNNEGRAQRFFQVFVPGGGVQESWRWVRDIMGATGCDAIGTCQGLDDLADALAEALPVFSRIPDVARRRRVASPVRRSPGNRTATAGAPP